MPTVFLAHWNEAELKERAKDLRGAGYTVRSSSEHDGAAAREIKKQLPDAVVIDLGRLPSHGRSLATWIRGNKQARALPIVFVEGDPEKTERAKRDFPECAFSTWKTVRSVLKKAIANPPTGLSAPKRADYSGTPLPKKLGVKPGATVALLGAPSGFEAVLGELPAGVVIRKQARGASDVIVLFAKSRADLERRFPAAHRALAEGGGLWVAWPKKAAGMASDLDQATVQRVGLDAGLVDNKICAVDATWSGQRFMRRRRRL